MKNEEINKLVAKKLGSQTTCHCDPLFEEGHSLHYATDMRSCWKIIEAVKDHFPMVYRDLDSGWGCRIGETEVWEDTATLAICLAFLKFK